MLTEDSSLGILAAGGDGCEAFVGDCGVERTQEEKHEESYLPRRGYIAAAGIDGGLEDLLGVDWCVL